MLKGIPPYGGAGLVGGSMNISASARIASSSRRRSRCLSMRERSSRMPTSVLNM